MTTQLNKKTVYLTFDDGPSTNTDKILDILKEYNIKATFFVVGRSDDKSNGLYNRILREGHAMGNHTYSHIYKTIYSDDENFLADFRKLEDYVYNITGTKMDIMRFPGGSNTVMPHKYCDDKFMTRMTAKMLYDGYQYFDWNVDSKDAKVIKQNKDVIISSVLKGVKNNNPAIVLLHDSLPKTTTIEALPIIIEKLLKEGYSFKTLHKNSFYVHFKR
ncbi:MAG TPA: polysaccharide deacetylase family protein [Clostridia bacterium]|nr:polysaccharide deacetylase family protein [Clostridia bacterium]